MRLKRTISGLKVLACVVLSLALVLAAGPAPLAEAEFAGFFSDVPPGHPAFDAANTLYLLGISEGDGDGHFYPDTPINRAELVKLVVLAKGMVISSQCAGVFADVPCNAWYGPLIELGHRIALVEAVDGAVAQPLAEINRQELFSMLVRAMGDFDAARRQGWSVMRERLLPFADAADVDAKDRPAAAWLTEAGFLDPAARILNPAGAATRADAAILIHKILVPSYPERAVAVVDGLPLRYREDYTMSATMYAAGEAGVGTRTATGLRVRPGLVAVDPTVIPLGTTLYVEGYGYAFAADTGGAIKGHKIDLYTDNVREAAYTFGRRTVRVYVVD